MSTHLVIGIMSCQKNRKTLQTAVRETWLQDLPSYVPYMFMEGGHAGAERIEGDRLYLHCEDTYEDQAKKTYRFLAYCYHNLEFDYLMKCDDDTYVHVDRLLLADFSSHHYVGALPRGIHKDDGLYAQGGAYILSRHAVKNIIDIPFESGEGKRWWYGQTVLHGGFEFAQYTSSSIEDIMIGDTLRECSISLHVDSRFNPVAYPTPYQNFRRITCHRANVQHMQRIHIWKWWIWLHPHRYMQVVQKFLRPYTKRALRYAGNTKKKLLKFL